MTSDPYVIEASLRKRPTWTRVLAIVLLVAAIGPLVWVGFVASERNAQIAANWKEVQAQRAQVVEDARQARFAALQQWRSALVDTWCLEVAPPEFVQLCSMNASLFTSRLEPPPYSDDLLAAAADCDGQDDPAVECPNPKGPSMLPVEAGLLLTAREHLELAEGASSRLHQANLAHTRAEQAVAAASLDQRHPISDPPGRDPPWHIALPAFLLLGMAAIVAWLRRSALHVTIAPHGLRLGELRLARGVLRDCELHGDRFVIRTEAGEHRWGPFDEPPLAVAQVVKQIRSILPTAAGRAEERRARREIERHQQQLEARRKKG